MDNVIYLNPDGNPYITVQVEGRTYTFTVHADGVSVDVKYPDGSTRHADLI